MNLYKEFWIENGSFIYACFDNKEHLNGWKVDGLGPWHVIEYKALLDEAEAHKNTAATLQKQIEKLQKQNEKLREALNYYTSPEIIKKIPIVEGFDYDEVIGEKARQTLKEIENDPAS